MHPKDQCVGSGFLFLVSRDDPHLSPKVTLPPTPLSPLSVPILRLCSTVFQTVDVPVYSDLEYQQHLHDEGWTRQETDHLFDLCKRFDVRFIVVHDRWDKQRFRQRSVEDLKERYYSVCNTLTKVSLLQNGIGDYMQATEILDRYKTPVTKSQRGARMARW